MKTKIFATSCALLALGVTGAATAQDQVGEDTASADTKATAAEPEVSLNKIIVTARKIEEAAMDVPVSATVISDEQLAALAVFDVVDIVRNIPNAAIAYGGGPEYLNTIIIRGAGAGRGPGTEPATGLYRNGIYVGGGDYGGGQFSRMDLFDVQRIEAFRGPQGALFGRNAVGGAINVVTQRPSQGSRNFASAAYNEFDRSEVKGAADIIASDMLGFRVGGFYSKQNDGYIQNTFSGTAADQREDLGLRLTAAVEPAADVSWRTVFEYYESSDPSFAAFVYRNPAQPFTRPYNGPSKVDIDRFTISSEFNAALSFADFTAAGLYSERNANRIDDLDWFLGFGGGLLNFLAIEDAELKRDGAELRLSSPSSSQSPLTWLIGVDYVQFTEDFTTINITTGAPTTRIFTEEVQSFSGFGSLGYDVSDRLNFTAELRVSEDRKKLNQQNGTRSEERDFSNIDPVISLTYAVNDEINVYARYATAFRAGGFNRSFPAALPDAARFDEEKTQSYEIGLKSVFSEALSFDVGLFAMRTADAQIVTRLVGAPQTYVQNAGNSEVYGVELDLRGGLSAKSTGTEFGYVIGASFSDGEYTKGTAIPAGGLVPIGLAGNVAPRLRDVTFNASLTAKQPISGDLSAVANVNYVSESGGFEDTFNTDELAGFNIVDLRAGLTWRKLGLYAVGKNIFNEVYVVENGSGGTLYSNRPSVWGIEARVAF